VELGFNTNENHQRIAENIQAQLKRNLGVEIELKNEEWKTYLKSLQAKNYQMFRMGWVGDFPDPDTFINLFITGGGNNHTLWGNKRYDELIALGVAEADKEKRRLYYNEAVKIINEDEVPIIPIYYYRDQYLINERVKNYPQNVMHKFYVQFTELAN
jgi:oligopeptide transport system substrate-binding protein